MIQLKAEELFFLGKIMNARYIDYDYVSLMDDIQDNIKEREKNAITGLVDKEVLFEDFSGDVELDEEAESLLQPVFFGSFEAALHHIQVKEESVDKNAVYKFHYHNGKAACVRMPEEAGDLILDDNVEEKISSLFHDVCPDNYVGGEKKLAAGELDQSAIEEILVLKNVRMNENEHICEFIKTGSCWYAVDEEDNLLPLTREQFRIRWKELLRG